MTDEKRVSELLPCPFCGNVGPELLDIVAPVYDGENPSLLVAPAYVHCSKCGAMKWGDHFETEDATAPWNRRSQQEPDGWRLVPVEPTVAMKKAGADYGLTGEGVSDSWLDHAARYYRAMLNAAPRTTP